MKTFTAHINGTDVEISSYSKYTLQATVGDAIVCTAPSRPKIMAKLEILYPAPVVTAEKPVKKISMRKLTLQLINEGKSDEEILAIITAEYTGKKYDLRHVKWYRSTFVRDGFASPEFAPKNGKMYKEWLATQQAAA